MEKKIKKNKKGRTKVTSKIIKNKTKGTKKAKETPETPLAAWIKASAVLPHLARQIVVSSLTRASVKTDLTLTVFSFELKM